jgi:hypothetical protein
MLNSGTLIGMQVSAAAPLESDGPGASVAALRPPAAAQGAAAQGAAAQGAAAQGAAADVVPAGGGAPRAVELGGAAGPEPTRYGDWERRGRCIDF